MSEFFCVFSSFILFYFLFIVHLKPFVYSDVFALNLLVVFFLFGYLYVYSFSLCYYKILCLS